MAFEQVAITVSAIDKTAERVIISFTNGMGMEFPGTWDEFVAKVDEYFRGWSPETAAYLGLARWINKNPTGANPNQLVGKTVTVNPGAANISNYVNIA